MDQFFDWLRYSVEMIIEMVENTKEWLEKAFPAEEEGTTAE